MRTRATAHTERVQLRWLPPGAAFTTAVTKLDGVVLSEEPHPTTGSVRVAIADEERVIRGETYVLVKPGQRLVGSTRSVAAGEA